MALDPNINTREFDKFFDNSLPDTGTTTVRTSAKISGGNLDAFPRGATGPFLVTTVQVTSTATKYPITALTDRVSLTIRNKDGTNTVFIGPTNAVTADTTPGSTSGWEVGPNEDFNIDLEETQDIYLICESGKTALIKVFEIASTGAP